MRRRFALLLAAACAGLALPAAAADPLRLMARESVSLDEPTAIAVFAVDPSTVEVSLAGGQVLLLGRRAGDTLVTVVRAASTQTLQVHVDPPAALVMAFEAANRRPGGFVEARYDSGTRRFSTSLGAEYARGDRTVRLRFEGVREGGQLGAPAVTALPIASIEIETPRRSIVLLDKLVQASPLTIDGVVVRGAHLREGPLEVHAGKASATPLDGFLFPGSGDRAFGASYRLEGEGGLRWTPSVLLLPDSGTAVPGVVALGVERGTAQDALQLKGELGWSDRPGASFEASYHDTQRQLWLKGVARPSGFAALRMARPAGSYVDGAWSEHVGEHSDASLSVSASRLDLERDYPQAASARAELRHQLDQRWSVTGGIGGGSFRTATERLSRGTVSFGTAYEAPNVGVAATYRYQATSEASHGGHGGRLALRGSGAGWRGNLFVDAQQQAPTLDLVVRDRSDIAHALAELGIAAGNPEDVVRQLRDNAALLAAHGVSLGTLRTDPLRVQAGLDLSWRGSGQHRPEVGVRVVADSAQAIASTRRNYAASVYANMRLFGDTDLSLSYTRWALRRELQGDDGRGSFQLALRTSFSTVGLPGEGGRAIAGQVLRDDDGTPEAGKPLAGVEVVLDRSRRTMTDRDGRFTFERPGAGAHRVDAVLPRTPGVYFKTPSSVNIEPGGDARFALAFSGARLTGTVRSDSGLPLMGVVLRLEGKAPATVVTDSAGAYSFAGPDGEARVTVVAESLPPGYELGDLAPRDTRLESGAPVSMDFAVRAQRGIEGMVAGTGGKPVQVLLLVGKTSRAVTTDAQGRFVLRAVPAGRLTLVVTNERGETRQAVEVPPEPGMVRGVQLAAP
ncbi:MAG: hypothetical protein V4864_01725 [Pseudomonadota bacterium]